MTRFVLPLADPQADVATVGGKGMSLARLARAGLPVPDGFHVTTEAYRCFVDANDLQPRVLSALDNVDIARPVTLESASATIGKLFADAAVPPGIAADIRSAYEALVLSGGGPDTPVAVRSSATAEDLPDASFAGQQDTYLNICGADAVVANVQKCWASLWTGRAIAYRLRQHIAPESVALAVVVQRLVPADAAGILFTANPLTGKRGEAVINASWGLGEAIVGGDVTPDTITVDTASGRIVERQTAEKRVMTVRTANGTAERPVPEALAGRAVLSDSQAVELARCGAHIEQLYGMPMDIEWTLEGNRFAIVQARPITSLMEASLEWKAPDPRGIYMRASIVDLMPDPLSPLFATLGVPALVEQLRLVGQALLHSRTVLHDDYYTTINRYGYMNVAFPPRTWWWVLTSMIPSYPRMLRTGLSFWRDRARPAYQQAVSQARGISLAAAPAGELWQAAIRLVDAAMYYVATLLFVTMGPTTGAEALLNKLYTRYARHEGDPAGSALLMGWNSIPVRAEKSLYDLATWIGQDKALTEYTLQTPTSDLAVQLGSPVTPVGAPSLVELASHLDRHMSEYGHAVFQMDFADDLPLDHPEPMIESIKMYLCGEGANPYERQKASEERRIQTENMALERLRGLRRWLFRKVLNWAQPLSEAREDALADIGLGYPLLRAVLLQLGCHLATSGVIASCKDVFWLEKQEIEAHVAGDNSSLADRVVERKAFAVRAKQAAPPPMLPFRKRFMGMKTSVWLAESDANQIGNTLKGIPACPGRVKAPACVLHGPEDFGRMRPGDVLVAGTTTPAWTPLFAMASAVVTDIGGPLSHGSIVAREYGIPAVMSTGVGTRRIHNGQIITVDGSAGTVTLTDTGG